MFLQRVYRQGGLKPGNTVWLTTPLNTDKFKIAGGDLIPVIREREKARYKDLLNQTRRKFGRVSRC